VGKNSFHSTKSLQQFPNKMNYSIFTVTFESLSIPISDGFKSYFNKTKTMSNISYLCFTYSMNNTTRMHKLNKTRRIADYIDIERKR
jgi:hypothetical protein